MLKNLTHPALKFTHKCERASGILHPCICHFSLETICMKCKTYFLGKIFLQVCSVKTQNKYIIKILLELSQNIDVLGEKKNKPGLLETCSEVHSYEIIRIYLRKTCLDPLQYLFYLGTLGGPLDYKYYKIENFNYIFSLHAPVGSKQKIHFSCPFSIFSPW